jgi:hypothetical protein
VNIIRRVAPWYSLVAVVFFFYGYYVLMFRDNMLESVMFIIAFLLFIYASVIMDDEWELRQPITA